MQDPSRLHELFSLQGKVALITGASSGIGAHLAMTLAAAGARVALAARRQDATAALAASLTERGADALAVAMDVTDPDSVQRAVADTEAHLGPIDVLVNNAGVTATASALDVTEEDWGRILETNLTGAWRVARAVANTMALRGDGGSIVNVASIVGMRPAGQLSAYATSKAGLLHLTRALALELARHRIRVNAIAPGYFSTPMNDAFLASPAGEKLKRRVPSRRFGDLRDLDGPLLLLCGPGSRHMTGATLTVDGGHSVSGL